MNKNYYPTYWSGCTPLHPVNNWQMVRSLVRACKNGKAESIPAIYTEGDLGSGAMLTGTHRSAANDIIMMLNDKNGTNIELINHINVEDVLTAEQIAEVCEINDDAQAAIDDMIENNRD